MDDAARSSRVANCRTVEQYEGDLDEHFDKDELATLLARLTYSVVDERQRRPAKHRIPINGNLRNGSATLKSAVSLYLQFRKFLPENGEDAISPLTAMAAAPPPALRVSKRKAGLWPTWAQPDQSVVLTLARELAPFVRFLHPDIVAAVADDNERHRGDWSSRLRECGIDPGIYLWEHSPCAFPGVRRYAGSREIARYRGHTSDRDVQPEHALRLDDNDFPKHLWSFVLRGRPFQKFGPEGYALAHLADHKEHNNRWADEFDLAGDGAAPAFFFGLYTSAANTVYVPTNFLKPTDFSGTLRTMLQRKAEKLYGDRCRLTPPSLSVKPAPSPDWEIDQFSWNEPVGTTGNIEEFLNYRSKLINDLLARRGG